MVGSIVVVSPRLPSNAVTINGNPLASVSSPIVICGSLRRSWRTRAHGTIPASVSKYKVGHIVEKPVTPAPDQRCGRTAPLLPQDSSANRADALEGRVRRGSNCLLDHPQTVQLAGRPTIRASTSNRNTSAPQRPPRTPTAGRRAERVPQVPHPRRRDRKAATTVTMPPWQRREVRAKSSSGCPTARAACHRLERLPTPHRHAPRPMCSMSATRDPRRAGSARSARPGPRRRLHRAHIPTRDSLNRPLVRRFPVHRTKPQLNSQHPTQSAILSQVR